MNRFRAMVWTSFVAGSLLAFTGSALAGSVYGCHGIPYKNQPLRLTRVCHNSRVKVIRPLKHSRNLVWIKGHYIRRNGHYRLVKGYWTVPPRHGALWVPGYWKRTHRRSVWVPGHWRVRPRVVVFESVVTEENNGPLIQIGPKDLSVTISLP
ncbi:MAG: YXWGXW repeat-containing protein [Deltaproteobacteria bacterium]|nr:YXWGXW repeat-containing protein [Deltaproteobacteria bacterium]